MNSTQSPIPNPQSPAPSPQPPFERYREIVDDWEGFQEAIKRPLPTTIWSNPLKTTPDELAQRLTDAGIPHEPIPWYDGGFRLPAAFKPGLRWEYLAGLYHVQEEVALLPVMLMDVQQGERILDMCAAPGNKTAQLSLALGNRATVVANDRNVGRMRAARQALNRLGLVNITMTTVDGGNYSKHAGQFDKVLVDVPCTCEGTCRRDRSILTRPINSKKLVGTQKALLRKATQLCKDGGRIVYATCTFAPEENELLVNDILNEFGDQLHILPAQLPDGFAHSQGLTEWQGQPLHPSLQHAIRVWPHQNDTGGFFIVVLEKKGEKNNQQSTANSQQLTDGQSPVHNSQLNAHTPTHPHPHTLTHEEEREPWLTIIADRFGIPKETFDDFLLYRVGPKKIYLINKDHVPPAKPKADSVGMHFMRVQGKYPKLTTGAAMLFAPLATRNVVEITAVQLKSFLLRQQFNITNDQATQTDGNGYVMLQHDGVFVGQGVFYQNGQFIESHFPKAWVRANVKTDNS